MNVSEKMPVEIDYKEFRWLKRGERKEIATETGLCESMVRATLRGETFNLEILENAMERVVKRKTKLLSLQAQAKQLSQMILMKVA